MNVTTEWLLANGISPETLATAKGAVAHTAEKTETPKPSKYRAVRTEYAGVVYDSKAEATRAAELDLMLAAGAILSWEPKPGTICLGLPENKYRPDFRVIDRDGERYEDVKGKETPKFRRDRKLWAAYGPCPLWVIGKGGTESIVPKRMTDTTGGMR